MGKRREGSSTRTEVGTTISSNCYSTYLQICVVLAAQPVAASLAPG